MWQQVLDKMNRKLSEHDTKLKEINSIADQCLVETIENAKDLKRMKLLGIILIATSGLSVVASVVNLFI